MTLGYRPTVAIFVPRFGEPDQSWLSRLCAGMTRLEPMVVCWERCAGAPEDPGFEVVELGLPWMNEKGGLGKLISSKPERPAFAPTDDETHAIRRVLYDRGVSVVFCHTTWTALRVQPVADNVGLRVVWKADGPDVSTAGQHKPTRNAMKTALANATVVTDGACQVDHLVNLGMQREQAHLIPLGVPIEFFGKAPVPERHLKPLRLIAVGPLVPEKGTAELLEALALVRKELSNTELVIIGDGPERKKLAKRAKEIGGVRFEGDQPESRIADELAFCHVFVSHPTPVNGREEGFGLHVLEAAAAGVPCVVPRAGCLPDQVLDRRNGLLFEAGNVEEQAEMILSLANQEDRRLRMGGEARQLASRFDAAQQTAKLEDLLLLRAGVNPADAA